MVQTSLSAEYDRFQNEAVESITNDFTENPGGRFLLVVPTGGGKTFIAVRAISRLYDSGRLESGKDRVVWVAHRKELLDQAKECFDKYVQNYSAKSHKDQIDFVMLSKVSATLLGSGRHCMVVIDEAHHGAAPSYQPIFDKAGLGVLGLTATPSRHDGKPLKFDRESYSIGFPELVDLEVVLRPEIVRVEGGRYEIDNLEELSALNNSERHQRIIKTLLDNRNEYKKVVVYAGTRDNAIGLYEALTDSQLGDYYEDISFVFGDENSKGIDREIFFKKEKTYDRSILVNVQVLSEGYDDPKINTVVMAAPTNSKLVYMQAIGRAIRRNPDDVLKRAFVVEVNDELPNIRYRIDNRWLFSDISDVLEPEVIDREFSTSSEFDAEIKSIYEKYEVPDRYRQDISFDPKNRFTLLLFKYASTTGFKNIPIFLNNDNRLRIASMFNFLSSRMQEFKHNVHHEAAFKMVNIDGIEILEDESIRELVYNAMESQASVVGGTTTTTVCDQYPWITFIALKWQKVQNQLPEDWVEFAEDMINRNEILELFEKGSYEPGNYLIKLPLPLSNSIGKIISAREFDQIEDVVKRLEVIKSEHSHTDHRERLQSIENDTFLPIEVGFMQSIICIVRESFDFYRKLEK